MRPVAPPLDAVLPRLRAVESSGQFSNFGPQETELRERYADWFNVPAGQVATAANATLGLTGAVRILEADTWVVPAFTFPATPAAVLNAGADLMFADIDASSWWLDSAGLKPTTPVVPVVPFGGDLEIHRWVGQERVVLDAAASIGCRPDLSKLPVGWAVVFSLHATKVLGSGEGGLVIFGSAESTQRFRSWSNFGFAGSRQSQQLATNAKMSEIHAAFAHAALDGWETEFSEWTAARALAVAICNELGVEVFESSRQSVNPYWIVRFKDSRITDHVESTLAQREIETRRWWSAGCHQMPAFRNHCNSSMPATDHVAATSLGLPFFRRLSGSDGEQIEGALSEALRTLE